MQESSQEIFSVPKESIDKREAEYQNTKIAATNASGKMEVINSLFIGGCSIIGLLALGLAAFILSHSKPKPDRATRRIAIASVIILVVIGLSAFGILLTLLLLDYSSGGSSHDTVSAIAANVRSRFP